MTDKAPHIARIKALRAKADGTTFPAEAESFRAGAERLMMKHDIGEADLVPVAAAPSLSDLLRDMFSNTAPRMTAEQRRAQEAHDHVFAAHRAYEDSYRRYARGERKSKPKLRTGMTEAEAADIRNIVDLQEIK